MNLAFILSVVCGVFVAAVLALVPWLIIAGLSDQGRKSYGDAPMGTDKPQYSMQGMISVTPVISAVLQPASGSPFFYGL